MERERKKEGETETVTVTDGGRDREAAQAAQRVIKDIFSEVRKIF